MRVATATPASTTSAPSRVRASSDSRGGATPSHTASGPPTVTARPAAMTGWRYTNTLTTDAGTRPRHHALAAYAKAVGTSST